MSDVIIGNSGRMSEDRRLRWRQRFKTLQWLLSEPDHGNDTEVEVNGKIPACKHAGCPNAASPRAMKIHHGDPLCLKHGIQAIKDL